MFENRNSKTHLSDLGEFGLIERLTKNIKLVNESSILGVGDDCAVIDAKDKQIIVTTDMLVEGIHFDISYTPLKHLGYKAVAVNLSDIAAMMGRPTQITVSMALSSKYTLEAIEEIYVGMRLCCKQYGVDLVGGDTSSNTTGLVISITAIGLVDKDKFVKRSTAKEGDLVCLSGNTGAAYMGLLLLQREKEAWKANPNLQPDLEGNDYVLERCLKPEPRLDIVQLLNEKGIQPTSMIDVSDGVASEIKHICAKSNVGCALYEDKLPIDPVTNINAELFKISAVTAALNGGEDYELLFTVKQDDYPKIKVLEQISIIGHITEVNSGVNLITRDNALIPIRAQGWDAFKKD